MNQSAFTFRYLSKQEIEARHGDDVVILSIGPNGCEATGGNIVPSCYPNRLICEIGAGRWHNGQQMLAAFPIRV